MSQCTPTQFSLSVTQTFAQCQNSSDFEVCSHGDTYELKFAKKHKLFIIAPTQFSLSVIQTFAQCQNFSDTEV